MMDPPDLPRSAPVMPVADVDQPSVELPSGEPRTGDAVDRARDGEDERAEDPPALSRGGDGPPPGDEVAGEEPGRSGGGWGPGRIVVFGLVVALVGMALGYVVSRPRPPGATSVDVGFVQDMIDHHDQAVLMGEAVVSKPNVDPLVRSFAQEVVRDQRWEVGVMDAWLQDWGQARGEPDRTVMGWMGMPVPLVQMPGLQSEAAMEQLRAADGREADRLFLTMMTDHHQGGIHMASYAATHASQAKVRELAQIMVTNQTSEVRSYQLAMAQLGLS
jgi:uncharacterized protein (DUF305 family)